MTATAETTATRKTPDPKPKRVTIVDRAPQLTVRAVEAVYSATSGQLNLVDVATGSPIQGTVRDASGAAAPQVSRSGRLSRPADQLGIGSSARKAGSLLDELLSPRVAAALEATEVRAFIVGTSVVEGCLRQLAPTGATAGAKAAYEHAAVTTPGGLFALPGFDEFAAKWKADNPDGGALETLRTVLEKQIAVPLNVAVVLVRPAAERETNPYFQTGVDPSAKGLLEARADTSKVGMRGGPVPGGRSDDPADHASNPDNWGILQPPAPQPNEAEDEAFREAFARNAQRRLVQDPATYVQPDGPPTRQEWDKATADPAWKRGEVTELDISQAGALLLTQQGGRLPRVAQLIEVGGNLLFSWGASRHSWSGGKSGAVMGETTPAQWAKLMLAQAVDVPGAKPEAVLVDTKHDVNLDELAQIVPILTLPKEPTS